MSKSTTETFYPKSRAEWRNWLENNHQSKQSIWLIYYKSSTKKPSLSWSEAVDEALCFGWIDSTKKTIDDESYMQYFSKRKANSNWSKINKEKVDQLIQNKLMTKSGFESIETAKQNGSWNNLDEIEALIVPEDLKNKLLTNKSAMEYFENLSKSKKKLLLHWVISAKRTATREKRINEVFESVSLQQMPKQFRSS
ncbi:YdeI/OmpD-associated family protein [Reichenbachiella versicolor]|uniref:YdeI/OmpD-associated family protein n=1 Tax=Reichenbachiella versicolor TaxID=1821036 RepID=UPI000D6E169B|nr:YdeI/OmpD-associated family protein [Reichenbachiella versicolor]